MSQREGAVSRQRSVETGLTQAIRPMLICASDSSIPVRNQQVKSKLQYLRFKSVSLTFGVFSKEMRFVSVGTLIIDPHSSIACNKHVNLVAVAYI